MLAQNVCRQLFVMRIHEDVELVHASDRRLNKVPNGHEETNSGDTALAARQMRSIVVFTVTDEIQLKTRNY